MTSILKRKRGAVEVKDTIKRAKSTKNNGKDVVRTIKENIWEKALENTTEGKELVKVNVEESLTIQLNQKNRTPRMSMRKRTSLSKTQKRKAKLQRGNQQRKLRYGSCQSL
jgi:hypothetical protein